MPNWCDTTYKLVGKESDLRAIKQILDKMRERNTPIHPNGFGYMWLGELVSKLGFDWEKYSCRGEITGYSLDDEVLDIYQQTAWCEQEGVRMAITEKFPDITVYIKEEELGCELFRTNDVSGDYFPERYLLVTPEDYYYCETIEEVARMVATLVGPPVDSSFEALRDVIDEHQQKMFDAGEESDIILLEMDVVKLW